MNPQEGERRIIPRWRDSFATMMAGELNSITPSSSQIINDKRDLLEKVSSWQLNKNRTFASDLLGTAIATGEYEEAKEAAQFLLEQGDVVPTPVKHMVERVLSLSSTLEDEQFELFQPQTELLRNGIHDTRLRLSNEPRNALLRVDLARLYANLGFRDQAIKEISKALLLAPNNRFVLRSASRLFVHYREPDRARWYLRHGNESRHDPWLLAAEIAVSHLMEQPSNFVTLGLRALNSRSLSNFHITELASAIGTIELVEGQSKKARRLFKRALVEPTDNSVAQADWASRRMHGLTLNDKQLQTPLSFEARAWEHYWKSDWEHAYQQSILWHRDEPFASKPAIFASFIATMVDDNEMSISIARRGLQANPGQFFLTNNLVFALASDGQVDEAESELSKVERSNLPTEQSIMITATEGLTMFRKKEIEKGRHLYQHAVELADGSSAGELMRQALAFWAREETQLNLPTAQMVLDQAIQASKGSGDPIAQFLLDQILSIDRYRHLVGS